MTAFFDETGTYRFHLMRDLTPLTIPTVAHPGATVCTFIMLNPSTADANNDDPTIRRCRNFALGWGFSHLSVVNLSPYRSTSPYKLIRHETPKEVIEQNRRFVNVAVTTSTVSIAAWGAFDLEKVAGASEVIQDLEEANVSVYCLERTKNGHPRHPLYTRGSIQMEEMELYL